MPRKKAVPAPAEVPAPPSVQEALVPVRRPRAPRPAPPNPTVMKLQEQLVPLLERKEAIQSAMRQSQRLLAEAQSAMQRDQQALGDTEAMIQSRLSMIAQLTGQPMPIFQQHLEPPSQLDQRFNAPQVSQDFYYSPGVGPQLAPAYAGEIPNLQGNPNIPSWMTSVPAPQNQRYASGYVPSGPDNPRSESAQDVKEDPRTYDLMQQIAKARAAV